MISGRVSLFSFNVFAFCLLSITTSASIARRRIELLGTPNQFRIVGEAFVVSEIPICRIFEPSRMAIQKDELRAATVQIGMNIVPLSDPGYASIIKQPDGN